MPDDDQLPPKGTDAEALFREIILPIFDPYLKLATDSLERTLLLVGKSGKWADDIADEILRATVVLTHAYLEDFLRSVALNFLPLADERILDTVPIAGRPHSSGRPEKFLLGRLAEHRGKTVDELIKQSVSEYLQRSNFGNMTEIISFLENLGLTLPDEDEELAVILNLEGQRKMRSALEAMMQRRHHIVHRFDKAKSGAGLEPIDASVVLVWIHAANCFMILLAKLITTKAITSRAK